MITLNPIYKPIYSTTKRYILITGGRGSGKSFEVNSFLTLLTYEARQKILFTRYTMNSATNSIIPELVGKIELFGVEDAFTINKQNILNKKTNSSIIFSGIKTGSGNQTAKLKSLADITTFVLDEAEEALEEEEFDKIDLSVRSKHAQNRVIMIMNSSDVNHFVYKRFIENSYEIKYFDGCPIPISTHKDCLHIHTTFNDNLANLDATWLDSIVRHRNTDRHSYYEHIALGKWLNNNANSLFNTIKYYNDSELLESNYNASFAYIDVADEGNDYTCLVIGKTIGSDVYIVDVYFSNENADITIPMCAMVLNKHKVAYCRVETNNMGAIFGRTLSTLATNTSILPCTSTSNKHTRIMMDALLINNFFKFRKDAGVMYDSYLKQLTNYTTKSKHDDAPDATSGLACFVRAMSPHLY